MPIKRIFLSTEQPALLSAAEFLVDRHARSGAVDLRNIVAVLPGGRAGRRLTEILVESGERHNLVLTPPTITTVGHLPELLYQPQRPFADDLVQQLVWAEVLQKFDPAKLAAVVADRPADDDSQRWKDLGRLLQALHRELASDALDFSDVVGRGRSLPGFAETQRWHALAEIQRNYLNSLDKLGLWDRQTARLFAIKHNECATNRPIVLIAAADLNRSTRRMLDQVSDQVTALVYSPSEWADRFDEHGCLAPETWQDVDLRIPEDSLIEADNPADQSDLVARRIAQFDGRFRAEEITVGLSDETLVPPLVRQLNECELPNRFGPGLPLARTAVYRMLENLAMLIENGRSAEFAQLVRHPDIETWLMRTGVQPGWIEELDDFYNEHLPRQITAERLSREHRWPRLHDAVDRIEQLTRRFQGEPRSLERWLPQISRILLDVYGKRDFDLEDETDRRAWKVCGTVQDALDDLGNLPKSLSPKVAGAEAIQLVLDQIATQRIAPLATKAAIELVGWLELPLDDAPALIVTSFNDGFVPSSANADMFLPGRLRSALGLDDNARRYARDAYAVTTLLTPWRETTFLVARRNADDDPLAPSRLLFAAPSETVRKRALRFFAGRPKLQTRRPLAGGVVTSRNQSAFDVPRPQPLAEPITKMSVTSFKTYLACPYRFYLSRVLKLNCVDDDAMELDGARFGELAHAVLERFGLSDMRDIADADVIEKELNYLLNQLVQERFGEHPGAALLVQVEQLRLRLQRFARWQAEWFAQGWRIEHSELSFSQQPGKLDVDGQPMQLTGRIDRIDVNENTGNRMILDYKTSDAGDSPAKTHRKRSGEWIDLQLPLYRHLVRELGIGDFIDLGYIVLPKSVAKVGLARADWTDEDLLDADREASEVIRAIRAARFWPPTDPPPAYSEEFASICMDGVFGRKKFT